jgi:hypothetical protein
MTVNKAPVALGLVIAVVAAVLGGLDAITRAQAGPPVAPGPAERVLYAPRTGGEIYDGAACGCEWVDRRYMQCGCHLADPRMEALSPNAGLTVQNVGSYTTTFMAVYFADASAVDSTDCTTCTYATHDCSPPVPPGAAFTFPPYRVVGGTSTPGSSMVVYSLNDHPAGVYGGEWAAYYQKLSWGLEEPISTAVCPQELGGKVDSAPSGRRRDRAPTRPDGDIAAHVLTDRTDEETELEGCGWYTAFHAAYTGAGDGRLPGKDLPIGPVRGEPIAGVVTVLARADGRAYPVLDRYAAIPLAETLATGPDAGAAAYTYYAPGGYGLTMDGNHSVIDVQNAGTSCATVTVNGHRNSRGPVGAPATIRVPAGGRVTLDVATAWPELIEMLTLRLESDQPLAAALTTRNVATSATSTAVRSRAAATRWLVPRAYQELREVVQDARDSGFAGPGEPGVPDDRDSGTAARDAGAALDAVPVDFGTPIDPDRGLAGEGADGWETNVAIFNPEPAQRAVTMRMQAAGQPPRGPIDYPVEALSQLVLQPGFGLGLPGGPGWMELTSAAPPMAVAVEGLREAPNLPGLTVETWATTAWPDEAGVLSPRTIALPDLGGPAVGGIDPGAIYTRTATMTDTLAASIAVQNPYTRTTHIAIDSYAPACGAVDPIARALGSAQTYVGTIERAIDPRQSIIVPLGDLPGTAFGGNAAVIRVLDGRAAATVEIARAQRLPVVIDDLPLDLASAYNGVPIAGALPAPAPVTATLAVTPTEIAVDYGDVLMPIDRDVHATDVSASGRCLTYVATSDAAWLSVTPGAGALPGSLRLTIDPRMITASSVRVGGRPVGTITVTLREGSTLGSPATVRVTVGQAGGGLIYLPYARTPGVASP